MHAALSKSGRCHTDSRWERARKCRQLTRNDTGSFVPSELWPSAYGILSVSALAVETEAEAEDATLCLRLATLRFAQGSRDLPVPTLAEARAHTFDEDELALVEAYTRGRHVGRATVLRDRLQSFAKEADADEIMVMTAAADHEARKRSYTLLAQAW